MQTIVVIEDDRSIRLGLVDTLRAKGYRADGAASGGEGLALCRKKKPDLVILDLMVPDLDGFDVLRRIKELGHRGTTVIMLTARGAELDRVRGLELGADDYVTKPFSLMELLARVKAVLRRARGSTPDRGPDAIAFGDVRIDFRRHEGSKGGQPIELSDRAYAVLQVFAEHRGEVITREQLLEEAWGYSRELNTRTVDNHIVKIRKQIEDDPNRPRHLLTVHGLGYKLAI